jgi:hypothetical protein
MDCPLVVLLAPRLRPGFADSTEQHLDREAAVLRVVHSGSGRIGNQDVLLDEVTDHVGLGSVVAVGFHQVVHGRNV